MMEIESFRQLLQQVRAGDADAAARLVREYEPSVRRYVRVHLTDPRLRQVLDTLDICQSVLGNFFIRVVAGQFELERPEQLLSLLTAMARNSLLCHVRYQQAGLRDQRRQTAGGGDALDGVPNPAPSPSQVVAGRELLERIQEQLDEDERVLLQRRMRGDEWGRIAADLGGSPEALRMKLSRALNRAGQALGLDEVEDL
jgi:RNA polymerase sigma-70 factor (ECF subfamily)